MEADLWHAVQKLESLQPTFVSVTYGAGGSTRERTHATVKRVVKETPLDVAGHLTCVAASRAEVNAVAEDYWSAGVRHIVALRGDPPAGPGTPYEPHPDGYATSADLVAGIKKCAPFEVTVGCYPEVHPEALSPQADIDVLKRKVDAGADRAITQFFFDADVFLRFLEKVRAAGITIPIVPGIMPIFNFKNVQKFAAKVGASIPVRLVEVFEGLDGDPSTQPLVAASCAAELCLDLREYGVDDFHFYTLNRPELVSAICRMLGVKPVSVEAGASEQVDAS
jgi:methylenetetrahydrofolate reductase (NADPH)